MVRIDEATELQYRRLFDRYHREVFAYCRRRVDAETAADCLAETFLVAWRKLDDVPAGESALRWLYGVARRVLANEFRRTRRGRRLLTRIQGEGPAQGATPDAVVVRRERDRTILTALAHLRPEDQELLRLAWWEELPRAEIATLLGCSTDAATARIYRAARRVAKEYERLTRHHPVAEMPPQPSGGEQR